MRLCAVLFFGDVGCMWKNFRQQEYLLNNVDVRQITVSNMYDFPLTFRSNDVHILHCFGQIARYWSKIAITCALGISTRSLV